MFRPSPRKQRPFCAPRSRPTGEKGGFLWGAIAALIWGGFFAWSSVGTSAGFDAADLAFLRYGTAGAVMLPWLLRRDIRSLGGVGWLRGAALALLAGPLFVLVGTTGFAFAPLAHGAVIQLGTSTLVGIVLAAIFTDERVDFRRAFGLALMIIGLGITVGPGFLGGGSEAWKGDLLFAGAGLMWALFTLLQRRWAVDPMAGTAAISVLALLTYAPAYLLVRGPQVLIAADPLMLFELTIVLGLFSGIISLFAFGRAVSSLGAARASLFPALAPGVAIILGVPLADEIPTLPQVGGLIILTAGLLLSIRQPRSRSKPPTECTRRGESEALDCFVRGTESDSHPCETTASRAGVPKNQSVNCPPAKSRHSGFGSFCFSRVRTRIAGPFAPRLIAFGMPIWRASATIAVLSHLPAVKTRSE